MHLGENDEKNTFYEEYDLENKGSLNEQAQDLQDQYDIRSEGVDEWTEEFMLQVLYEEAMGEQSAREYHQLRSFIARAKRSEHGRNPSRFKSEIIEISDDEEGDSET